MTSGAGSATSSLSRRPNALVNAFRKLFPSGPRKAQEFSRTAHASITLPPVSSDGEIRTMTKKEQLLHGKHTRARSETAHMLGLAKPFIVLEGPRDEHRFHDHNNKDGHAGLSRERLINRLSRLPFFNNKKRSHDRAQSAFHHLPESKYFSPMKNQTSTNELTRPSFQFRYETHQRCASHDSPFKVTPALSPKSHAVDFQKQQKLSAERSKRPSLQMSDLKGSWDMVEYHSDPDNLAGYGAHPALLAQSSHAGILGRPVMHPDRHPYSNACDPHQAQFFKPVHLQRPSTMQNYPRPFFPHELEAMNQGGAAQQQKDDSISYESSSAAVWNDVRRDATEKYEDWLKRISLQKESGLKRVHIDVKGTTGKGHKGGGGGGGERGESKGNSPMLKRAIPLSSRPKTATEGVGLTDTGLAGTHVEAPLAQRLGLAERMWSKTDNRPKSDADVHCANLAPTKSVQTAQNAATLRAKQVRVDNGTPESRSMPSSAEAAALPSSDVRGNLMPQLGHSIDSLVPDMEALRATMSGDEAGSLSADFSSSPSLTRSHVELLDRVEQWRGIVASTPRGKVYAVSATGTTPSSQVGEDVLEPIHGKRASQVTSASQRVVIGGASYDGVREDQRKPSARQYRGHATVNFFPPSATARRESGTQPPPAQISFSGTPDDLVKLFRGSVSLATTEKERVVVAAAKEERLIDLSTPSDEGSPTKYGTRHIRRLSERDSKRLFGRLDGREDDKSGRGKPSGPEKTREKMDRPTPSIDSVPASILCDANEEADSRAFLKVCLQELSEFLRTSPELMEMATKETGVPFDADEANEAKGMATTKTTTTTKRLAEKDFRFINGGASPMVDVQEEKKKKENNAPVQINPTTKQIDQRVQKILHYIEHAGNISHLQHMLISLHKELLDKTYDAGDRSAIHRRLTALEHAIFVPI